ncbi:hypothetical protein HK104_009146 [Borealophlyctis nickersoniae]|nr:hypothetical protein HK104_009146 [Borealophlyctis nickersoniae]
MSTPLPLTNKVAIVTGGSRGIGRSICQRLAQDGANVVVNYNSNAAEAQSVVDEINAAGKGKAVAVQADVSKVGDVKVLVGRCEEEFGKIDFLVLNAGIQMNQSLHEITEESFDKSFGVNVKGPLFLAQTAAPKMSEGGRIIFFSTSLTAATMVAPNYALYNATKGAVEQLARVLAKDLGKRGINVNTISPGPTATDLFLNGKSEQQINFLANLSPFGRLGQPDDIASVVAFLVGPDAKWVSGQNIRVNGAFVV